jgi:hypothetical protein
MEPLFKAVKFATCLPRLQALPDKAHARIVRQFIDVRFMHCVEPGGALAGFSRAISVSQRERVVTEDRRNCNEEAEGCHDQRLANWACERVDRRLSGRTDRQQRVIDAPNGAEQTDERCSTADRGEDCGAALHFRDRVVHRVLQTAGDPVRYVHLRASSGSVHGLGRNAHESRKIASIRGSASNGAANNILLRNTELDAREIISLSLIALT